jgi:hypothetical protein
MERKLIKLVNNILRSDPASYLWHRDDTLKNHFRIGTPQGPHIECSWEVVGKETVGQLVVRQDEHTELRWPVERGSELDRMLFYLEQNAIRLPQDEEYLKRLKKSDEPLMKKAALMDIVEAFFGTR